MKKLLTIFAASATAGLLAGAGFRLGETMAAGQTELKPESGRGTGEDSGIPAEKDLSLSHRVARLEKEVAGHSEGLTELRECSLRTERTLQKLLMNIDRLIPTHAPFPPIAKGNGNGSEDALPLSRRETRHTEAPQ